MLKASATPLAWVRVGRAANDVLIAGTLSVFVVSMEPVAEMVARGPVAVVLEMLVDDAAEVVLSVVDVAASSEVVETGVVVTAEVSLVELSVAAVGSLVTVVDNPGRVDVEGEAIVISGFPPQVQDPVLQHQSILQPQKEFFR